MSFPGGVFSNRQKREIAKNKNENTVNGKNLGVRCQLVLAGFVHLEVFVSPARNIMCRAVGTGTDAT